jgi:uncharacterized protein YciI
MKFIVQFEDNPNAGADIRAKYLQEHLAFLERNAGTVEAAGPLKTREGEGSGGLWVVEADDPAEVDLLVKADPFWATGLRKSVHILAWTQVFANGRRLTGR